MESKIKELHQNLFSLLIEIDSICAINGIKYSLFAGTLIGAIRHHNFIPWDDDADVVFERVEFEKFLKCVPDNFEIFRDPWVPRFRRKGSAVFLDLFVFDSTSNIKWKQDWQILRLKFLQGTLKSFPSLKKGSVFEKTVSVMTYLLGLFFSKSMKVKMYDRVASMHNNSTAYFIFSSLDQFKYIGIVIPREAVNSYEKIDFGGAQLMIMSGYHSYLTQFYGDYMQLPPVEKRIPEHGNV